MTQRQLERLVAAATGESVAEIRRRGFGRVEIVGAEAETAGGEDLDRFADWDAIDAARHRIFPQA